MDEAFFSKYGLAGILILLTLNVLVKVGAFIMKQKEKKDSLSEDTIKQLLNSVQQSTIAIAHLEMRLKTFEQNLNDLPKFKTDIRRFYTAMKVLSGEKWPDIRKEIIEDEI